MQNQNNNDPKLIQKKTNSKNMGFSYSTIERYRKDNNMSHPYKRNKMNVQRPSVTSSCLKSKKCIGEKRCFCDKQSIRNAANKILVSELRETDKNIPKRQKGMEIFVQNF